MAVKKTNRKPAATAGKKNATPKTKATSRRKSQPALSKRVLNNADDVYQTKNCIAVRNVESVVDKRTGRIELIDKTRYYPKTQKNLTAAQAVHGRIRAGRN